LTTSWFLSTSQELSELPSTLSPGTNANIYPPEHRFAFDNSVVRTINQL
jgi:hypothetical protein